MDTIILGNTAYTTLKQLQEMTTQFPAIETPFAQDNTFNRYAADNNVVRRFS